VAIDRHALLQFVMAGGHLEPVRTRSSLVETV
jgi:hypothetical protein